MTVAFGTIYEPRDERVILRAATRSRQLPAVTPSHERQLLAQQDRLDKVNGLEVARRRKKAAAELYSSQLELERLRGLAQRARMPGLRGMAGRMAQLERTIGSVNRAVPS